MYERRHEFFTEVDTPETGDLVLLKQRGIDYHAGMFVKVKNKDYILHVQKRVPACIEKLDYLLHSGRGYELAGYHRCRK